MNNVPEPYDVAIIGFGPTGAMAAALLGAQGFRVFVCDRLRDVYDKPRAIALDHEILRVFQGMGVLEQIEQYTEPFTDSVHYGVHGQEIRRMSTVPVPYPLAHNPSVVFTQPPVERILRAHAQSFSGVNILLGTILVGLEQQDETIRLLLRGEDGTESAIRAKYVIGCDGASSTVRGLANIELEDLDFDEPWLVVDAVVNEAGIAKLPKTSAQFCNPARPISFLICPNNHRRWEIAINPDDPPEMIGTPEFAWKLLSPWISPEDATLWRQASYRFHALVAKVWRRGNVFVAGDAAHQQPPFLGQGMCQGVRDVANLCWKLTAVMRGEARSHLLETYGEERYGHVKELTTRIKHIGRSIGERDLAKALARDAELLRMCGGEVKPTPRQDVQPALKSGLLSAHTHPARGTIFPQPWLVGSGPKLQRMDDRLGSGWRVILAAGASLKLSLPQMAHLKVAQLGADGMIEADGVLQQWFERHHAIATIVRPDHYVFGVAATVDELQSELAELAGQMNKP